jgi:tetratricopeptide (TPR) repeat protein
MMSGNGLDRLTAEAIASLRSALAQGQDVGDALRAGFARNAVFFNIVFVGVLLHSFGDEPDPQAIKTFVQNLSADRFGEQLGFEPRQAEALIRATFGDYELLRQLRDMPITSPAIPVAVMQRLFAAWRPTPSELDELFATAARSEREARIISPPNLYAPAGGIVPQDQIDLEPTDANLFIDRARRYEQAGDRYAALADYDRAAALDPGNLTALTERGALKIIMDRREEALADFEYVISLSPADANAIKGRGDVRSFAGEYAGAVSDYDRVIALGAGDQWTFVSRAEALRLLERYEEALADASRAIALDDGNAELLAERALVYKDMGRHEDAIADLDRVLEIVPDDSFRLANRAVTYQVMGRFEDSLADFNRAIELNPDDAWMLVGRGELYAEMGRSAEAQADFARAVELEPEYAAELAQYLPGSE